MLARVLLASQHGFVAAEPVLAELGEARRALAHDGVDLTPLLLDDPAHAGSPPDAWRHGLRQALHEGADIVVIRGTTVSAEHVSGSGAPLNLKEFIYELEAPVIVGG